MPENNPEEQIRANKAIEMMAYAVGLFAARPELQSAQTKCPCGEGSITASKLSDNGHIFVHCDTCGVFARE